MEFNYYPKIDTIYKRDFTKATKKGAPLIVGEYSTPEFEYLKDLKWIGEEKVDGTNIGVHFNGHSVMFTGHREESKIHPNLLERLKDIFTVDVLLPLYREKDEEYTISLYGEGVGEKIQDCGRRYCSNGTDFILFDVKIGKWWLKREVVEQFAQTLNIKCAPVIGEFTFGEAIDLVKKGFKSQIAEDKTLDAEGLVLKSPVGLLDRSGQRLITKIKVKDFKNI